MVVFSSLCPRGFLSFGPSSPPFVLGEVNLLLDPNASGKSNLVECLDILRAAPGDLPLPFRQGGGVREWLWQGIGGLQAEQCQLELIAAPGLIARKEGAEAPGPAVRYKLSFGADGERFSVLDERIECERATAGSPKPYFYFGYENGVPMKGISTRSRSLNGPNWKLSPNTQSTRPWPGPLAPRTARRGAMTRVSTASRS